jgi:hypothetical protein
MKKTGDEKSRDTVPLNQLRYGRLFSPLCEVCLIFPSGNYSISVRCDVSSKKFFKNKIARCFVTILLYFTEAPVWKIHRSGLMSLPCGKSRQDLVKIVFFFNL